MLPGNVLFIDKPIVVILEHIPKLFFLSIFLLLYSGLKYTLELELSSKSTLFPRPITIWMRLKQFQDRIMGENALHDL